MKFSEALAKCEEVVSIAGGITKVTFFDRGLEAVIVLDFRGVFRGVATFGAITIVRKGLGEFEPKEVWLNVLGDCSTYVWNGGRFVEKYFSPASDPTAGPFGWRAT